MEKRNSVFIATSLDGFIADKQGGIDYLHTIPEIDTIDTGYHAFLANIDALIMGRTTFDTVCGFDIEWPYTKPVFVLSTTLQEIPGKYKNKVWLLSGTPELVLDEVHRRGFHRLYIDGGKTIQGFLREDLIDDMVITTIPVLLGEGFSLFGALPKTLEFACTETRLYLDKVVQCRFERVRVRTPKV
ncbi:MAG TPA: dihydrofolate reductase family protein [Ohtaekwangia sp.]